MCCHGVQKIAESLKIATRREKTICNCSLNQKELLLQTQFILTVKSTHFDHPLSRRRQSL